MVSGGFAFAVVSSTNINIKGTNVDLCTLAALPSKLAILNNMRVPIKYASLNGLKQQVGVQV